MSGARLDLLDTPRLEDELEAIFPRCSPKSAPSTPASSNISFISSISNLNKKELSPDLNQNRRSEHNSNSGNSEIKKAGQMDNIVLSRRVAKSTVRMDVSSPSETHDGLYEDVFRGRPYTTSSEDVYSRAYPPSSSGSSSPSSNEIRRGGSSSRERDGDSGLMGPGFLDTKIEIAGGREIFSRSRNGRHKRAAAAAASAAAAARSEKRLSQDREVAQPLHYGHSSLYSQEREGQHLYGEDRENLEIEEQHLYSQERESQHLYSQDRTIQDLRVSPSQPELGQSSHRHEAPGSGLLGSLHRTGRPSTTRQDRHSYTSSSSSRSAANSVPYQTTSNATPFQSATNSVPFQTATNSTPYQGATNTTPSRMRETIFSTEVHSVEYEKDADGGDRSVLPPGICGTGGSGSLGGTVFFDDIGDLESEESFSVSKFECEPDPNVTYDLIEGHLPPPGLSVLAGDTRTYTNQNRTSVDELLSQTPVSEAGSQPGHHTPSFCLDAVDSGVDAGDHLDATHSTNISPVLSSRLTPHSASLDNLYLEDGGGSDSGRAIGALTIAEYEGSPRRYGRRPAPADRGLGPSVVSASHSSASSGPTSVTSSKSVSPSRRGGGGRRPGFPQRVLPTITVPAPVPVPIASVAEVGILGQVAVGGSEARTTTTVDIPCDHDGQVSAAGPGPGPLLHFDDVSCVDQVVVSCDPPVSSCDDMSTRTFLPPVVPDNSYDYRYEFSETRKVLEEFFKAETEYPVKAPAVTASGSPSIHSVPVSSTEFVEDLDYSLKRHAGNSYVGQRLALDTDDDILPAVISRHAAPPPQEDSGLKRMEDSSSSSLTDLEIKARQDTFSRDLLDLCGTVISSSQPSVGISPLDCKPVEACHLACDTPQRDDTPTRDTPPSLPCNGTKHSSLKSSSLSSSLRSVETGRVGPGVPRTERQSSVETQYDSGRDLPPPPAYDCSRNFTLSPETTDCDSADLESELSVPSGGEGSYHSSGPRIHTSMPILEDGLSSGHASDLDDDPPRSPRHPVTTASGLNSKKRNIINSEVLKINAQENLRINASENLRNTTSENIRINAQGKENIRINAQEKENLRINATESLRNNASENIRINNQEKENLRNNVSENLRNSSNSHEKETPRINALDHLRTAATENVRSSTSENHRINTVENPACNFRRHLQEFPETEMTNPEKEAGGMRSQHRDKVDTKQRLPSSLDPLGSRLPPPSPAPDNNLPPPPSSLSDFPSSPPPITTAQETNFPTVVSSSPPPVSQSSETVAAAIKDIRKAIQSAKALSPPLAPTSAPEPQSSPGTDPWVPRGETSPTSSSPAPPPDPTPSTSSVHSPPSPVSITPPPPVELQEETDSEIEEERVPTPEVTKKEEEDLDTDQETDRLLGQQYNDDNGYYDTSKNESSKKKASKTKEGPVTDPKVLIEGVLFRARYLGSTQLVCEGQPTKATRMMQAEEAVSRIKAPEGETQPSTEVDLFISTEKIMVLNTDLKEIMMDHGLRTISYIADIGDLVVIMARRRVLPQEGEEAQVLGTTPKMICHVFESEEAQFIAQSIGQAFQVAYMEFLKANGIEDHSFVKEMDYQEVLNSQEIYGDELAMFAKKELQKEVVVPKSKGEILGVVIVESGWGSMLPTIVIANLCPTGPAARCGHLNIGDQVIAINGVSLVGLPLSTCQQYIKNTKNKTAVKLTAVSCAPVVEVKIKRPDTKYQLGFSVQNGVICSLLRGGIAERGGVRVGHRIIEINGQSVVAVPHERIVNLLATSVGEIHMKTMPTSMYRLLTGQETPVYI